MYHVALGVAPEDDQLRDKVEAIAGLPQASESVRVTVVHFHDGETSIEEVPVVAEALELLDGAGLSREVHDTERRNASRGLVETAEDLDVDLLCIGGRHRSPAGKLQLKTGAQEVVLRAAVPVLVTGDVESREPRT